MDAMEDKLGSILGNPEMMQKIMDMAQTLNTASPTPTESPPREPPRPPEPPVMPNIDLAAIQKLSGFMGKTNIDREQQALLSALRPYLSKDRIQKLENAMRATKLAAFAALALRDQKPLFPTGR